MPRPYNDARYLQWHQEFNQMVYEFLDTEGNRETDLDEIYNQAKAEAKEE